MVLLQLGKEITPEAIGDITSSSPEIGGSGDSSLTNGHSSSLSDIINDWRRELEEKNSELRHKIAITNSLEERLQEKDLELCETRNECKAAQIERDKNCLMVSNCEVTPSEHLFLFLFCKEVNFKFYAATMSTCDFLCYF